eukprot:5403693-Pyramimonas_sp.AAC.1
MCLDIHIQGPYTGPHSKKGLEKKGLGLAAGTKRVQLQKGEGQGQPFPDSASTMAETSPKERNAVIQALALRRGS